MTLRGKFHRWQTRWVRQARSADGKQAPPAAIATMLAHTNYPHTMARTSSVPCSPSP